MDRDPDQIDMMSEKELRVELRILIEKDIETREVLSIIKKLVLRGLVNLGDENNHKLIRLADRG